MARHVSAWLAKGVYSIDDADRCPLSPHKRRKSGHFLTAASCQKQQSLAKMGPRAVCGAAFGLSEVLLLGGAVVARGLLELLDVRRRQLRPIDLQRELVELAGELERHLVLVGHRRPGVGADVEVLVPLHNQRDRVPHGLTRNLLAVDFQHSGAAAADTAYVVEREGAQSEAVILEVELKRVLAWR